MNTVIVDVATPPEHALPDGSGVLVSNLAMTRYVCWRGAWRACAFEAFDEMTERPDEEVIVEVDGEGLPMTLGALRAVFAGEAA